MIIFSIHFVKYDKRVQFKISMQSQIISQSHIIDPHFQKSQEKTPLRTFSFNDTQGYRKSTDTLWQQVYQYPSDRCFFKRNKTIETHAKQKPDKIWNQNTIPSAKQAWSLYDPEKEQAHPFSIFRQTDAKSKEEDANIKIREQSQFPQPPKRGWADLLDKPAWGTSYEKPPPFMGAFDHVQPQFGHSLNISVPSMSSYNPYSQYLQDSQLDISNPYKNQQKVLEGLQDSKQWERKERLNQRNKYYFELESVQSKQDIGNAPLQEIKQSRIEHQMQEMDRSALWTFQVLFADRGQFKHANPSWQTPQQKLLDSSVNSKIFQCYKESHLQLLPSLESQVNLQSEIQVVVPDSYILSQISKMLQNVQCQLFTLDYSSLTWKLQLLSFRPEMFLRNSLGQVLSKILEMASNRSRINCALLFLQSNKYRKVYCQLASQVSQFLILFDQIVLQLTSSTTLLDFINQADKLSSEIKLIYNLLINQEYIMEQGKIYDDFDFRFLHSEVLIFKRVLKLSRNADAVELQTNPLVVKLLEAVFKPLLVLLQKILFQECQYLQLNTDLYLKYYFSDPKELVQMIGKKMHMIKQQSNELYLICKVRQPLALLHHLPQLISYQQLWRKSFHNKHKLINRIRKEHKQKIRWQHQKKREEKMKEIYELKSKIYQLEQEESLMQEGRRKEREKELIKMKKQIQEKKERRILIEQIQKQMEKNVLLDIELEEKEKLKKEKEKLAQELAMDVEVAVQVLQNDQKQDIAGKKEASVVEKEGSEKGKAESEIKIHSQLQVDSKVEQKNEQKQQKMEEQLVDAPQAIIAQLQQVQLQQKSQAEKEKYEQQPQQQHNFVPQSKNKKDAPLELQSKLIVEQEKEEKQPQPQPQSQPLITSNQSIQSLQQKYTATVDAFFNKTQKDNFKNRTSSYFRMLDKPKLHQSVSSLSQNSVQLSSQQSIVSEQAPMDVEDGEPLDLESELAHRHIDVQTCLSICVDQVVKKQTEVIQHCLRFIILQKYQILQTIQFLRQTFMSGNGQKMQQFIHLSITDGSMISLKHFSKCLLFDTHKEHIQKLSPCFYHSKSNIRHSQINIFEDHLDHYIGFQFTSLPPILQPIFSYIHLSKYMQIFSFILRLRHCQNLLSQSWKLLNIYKKSLGKQKRNGGHVQYQMHFMNKLCLIRYKISNFLKTFENYFFWRVIEKEYKNIRPKMRDLDELGDNHLKMLDNIIRYGLIDNPNHNISKSFRQILSYIHQFFSIVHRLTLDDIPSYAWQQTQKKVELINKTFDKQLKDIEVLLFRPS